MLRQYRATPFEADLRRIFARLRDHLPDTVSIELDTAADCIAVLPPVRTDYEPATFAVLARAVVEQRRVRVAYYTPDRDATTARTLDPYRLVLRGDDWYVLAHDSHRGEVRVFAVQRVRDPELLDERFTRPEGFDPEAFLADAFRVIRGEGHHEVVLHFRPPSAQRIAEKTWHPTQTLEPHADGVLLRISVGDLREVRRWVLYWGSDCEVVGPDELRAEVRAEVDRIRSHL
jgi:predicted DNA-binding transcriptional regulator YafY